MSGFARWETESRYYLAVAQQDLFGQWEVYRVWGARRSHLGGCMREPAESEADALHRLQKVARQRIQRGYLPASVRSHNSGDIESTLASPD